METMIYECDNCNAITKDLYNEIGWIQISDVESITVFGGRRKNRCSDSFRYFSGIKSLHFCGWKCLLNYLYYSDGHFNGESNITFKQKIESIDSETRKKQLLKAIPNPSLKWE